MSKIEKFEDLIVWQEARKLTQVIYQITKSGPFSKDFGLVNQIQRASVSVMSNIAEGFERASAKQLFHFLAIAKGSCAELRSELYIAFDLGYLERQQFLEVFRKAESVAKLIGGLRMAVINYQRRNN